MEGEEGEAKEEKEEEEKEEEEEKKILCSVLLHVPHLVRTNHLRLFQKIC